ncbi:hypothetical protein K1940_004492 [Salmonella enterica subsp. enterica serovar Larochelle]|nr:hypothetical protein [Salmonella enterica subsp. enterica serovar Larochelle]
MEIIDILIVVDAIRILNDHGKNNAAHTGEYVNLKNDGHNYIYMLGTWYHIQDQADSELDIFAKPGDKIRWRMTTLSMGEKYQGIIKEFVITGGKNNITPPRPAHKTIITPRIDTNELSLDKAVFSMADDIFWESTVLQPGPVTYHTKFVLYAGGGGGGGSNHTGSDSGGGGCNHTGSDGGCGDCGGYQWDPFINK